MGTHNAAITLETKGNCDIIDITSEVENTLKSSALSTGICTVFCPGSTGSVTTIEYENGLLKDFLQAMERLAPIDVIYEHHLRWRDGNGHSHIRASILGPSLAIPFVDGKLTLGTWQQIAFIDFDNKPRRRRIDIIILGE